MDKVTAYFHGELMRIKKEDPARFQEIHDYECPHDYGLPSCHDNHICELSSCDQCWKDAMELNCRNRNPANLVRMVIQRLRTWVWRLKGAIIKWAARHWKKSLKS